MLGDLQDLRLRVHTLGLQLGDHGGQRHGQRHVYQRRPGQRCRTRGKLHPVIRHGRYSGERLGPRKIGQPRVLELHLRQGGWSWCHWYGLKQQQWLKYSWWQRHLTLQKDKRMHETDMWWCHEPHFRRSIVYFLCFTQDFVEGLEGRCSIYCSAHRNIVITYN